MPNLDSLFRAFLFVAALLLGLLFVGLVVTLGVAAWPSLRTFGFSFLVHTTWDPVFEHFGALSFIVGTLATSFLALLISLPFALSISFFLGEYFQQGLVSVFFKGMVELLAGIPSVIYGFWGIFVLVPFVRTLEIQWGVTPYGVGLLTASVILAIMIIPYSTSVAQEVIRRVPLEIKEAAYSLGATRYEVVRGVIFPFARSGIFSGLLLALGRALGETMAVTMVIGNVNILPHSLFAPTNTMASVIANEFTEAIDPLHLSSLIEVGLLLFFITLLINVFAQRMIQRWNVES